MKLINTIIENLYIIKPTTISKKGSSTKIFFNKNHINNKIQFRPNYSAISFNNTKGSIRGLHFQKNPYAEAKLVKCLSGSIFDVVIDLRKKSPSYKKVFNIELNTINNYSILIPKGCAHGYQTLKDNCKILYLTQGLYKKNYESGIRWNDEYFDIKWPLKTTKINSRDGSFFDFKG